MASNLKLLLVAVALVALGSCGWFVTAAAYHLYLDHLAVDQWRQEIIQQRLKILEQQQQQPPPVR